MASQQPEIEKHKNMIKVSGHYIDTYFTTAENLERWSNVLLLEQQDRDTLEIIKVSGFKSIDLTVAKQRAMLALFYLYTWHNFPIDKGVLVSLPQYYRAYGIRSVRTKRGKFEFQGREIEQAQRALFELEREFFTIAYKSFNRYDKARRRKLFNAVVRQEQLCRCAKVYKEMSEEDFKRLPDNVQSMAKLSGTKLLWCKLNPVLLRDFNYFKLVRQDFWCKIQVAVHNVEGNRGRVSKYILNFFLFLLRQRKNPVEIHDTFLFAKDILKMSQSVVAKRPLFVKDRITKIFKVFEKAGYLLEYRVDEDKQKGGAKDILVLNEQEFPHLRQNDGKKVYS